MCGERHGDEVLASIGELREHALMFAGSAPGPLRMLRMQVGDASIEVEWQESVATADGVAVTGAAAAGPPGSALAPAGAARPRLPARPDTTHEHRGLVTAPMVGTFYRAPAPGADPFVEVGDLVEPGQTVGIVEAMKLMNHIQAESGGRVIQILVRDTEPVQFGQALIALSTPDPGHGNGAQAGP